MINSKLGLCFCAFSLMISSSAAESNFSLNSLVDDFIKVAYKNHNWTIISRSHEKYPDQICATTLNETDAYWDAPELDIICSTNITCKVRRTDVFLKLDVTPETGVVCQPGYVCLNGTCTYLKVHLEISKPKKEVVNISTSKPTTENPPVESQGWFLNFLYFGSLSSIFRSIFTVHSIPPVH